MPVYARRDGCRVHCRYVRLYQRYLMHTCVMHWYVWPVIVSGSTRVHVRWGSACGGADG